MPKPGDISLQFPFPPESSFLNLDPEQTSQIIMENVDTWTTKFFSGAPPHILQNHKLDDKEFRAFSPGSEDWTLGPRADPLRIENVDNIQVLWIKVNKRKKYIGKVVSTDNTWCGPS